MALPRVIILYDAGAFAPAELAEAARGLCQIVWVTGWPGERRTELDRLLPRLGIHVDVSGCGIEEIVSRLRVESAEGIAVFSEAAIEPTTLVAEALRLPFHSRETAHRLRDKFVQRRTLADAGLDVPRTRVVTAEAVRSKIDVEALEPRWPAVLKPRRGMSSIETFFVRDADELLETLASASPGTEFVLEDFLADRASSGPETSAGLFSVELLVDGDVIEPIALTGRFPFKPPFRETGSFIPSDVDPEDAAAAVRYARDAAIALRVRRGILHVELKRTPDGPRIVEVNGRVGGLVPTLLTRAGGPSILTLALQLALGLEVGPLHALPPDAPVAFYHAWLPPVGEFRLTALAGLKEIDARPEIDRAWPNMRPGETVSSREGGGVLGYVAAVFGIASSHLTLWPLRAELEPALSLTFEPLEDLSALPESNPRLPIHTQEPNVRSHS
jgi:hypothetical protein